MIFDIFNSPFRLEFVTFKDGSKLNIIGFLHYGLVTLVMCSTDPGRQTPHYISNTSVEELLNGIRHGIIRAVSYYEV